MRYAIFSDIHGNLPAWEQVLADIQNLNADVLICLGDVVGYGPKPQEVLDGIRAVTDHFVLGNHDAAAAGIIDPTIFNDHAHAVVLWTREALNKESLDFLNQIPLELETPDLLFVHAEVPEPGRFGYIENEVDAGASFAARKHFVTFVGHTHYPECFEQLRTGAVRKLGDQDRVLEARHRYIINVGSVGEPRNPDDIRARYVIYDDDTRQVSFRRIDFDPNVYRDQLRATTLTHTPYFIRVLEDQAAAVAEVQDMQVLDQAVSGAVAARRTLLMPGTAEVAKVSENQPELASIKSGESSQKSVIVILVTMLALIGALLFWMQSRKSNEAPEVVQNVIVEESIEAKEESAAPSDESAEIEASKEGAMVPESKSEEASTSADLEALFKPVFAIDASRPVTWQRFVTRQKNKRPTLTKYGSENLRLLNFDGKDDFLHAKPVLKAGDDTFTYIALINPRSISRAQVICEQSGKEAGTRACLQLTADRFIFNGDGNDTGSLGKAERDKWQLIAMIVNGKAEENVIAIRNNAAPVFGTIDIAKQKVGNIGFRVGHKIATNSQYYRGRLAELEVYDHALSSAQLEKRLTKLQEKWGLKFKLQIPEMEAVE